MFKNKLAQILCAVCFVSVSSLYAIDAGGGIESKGVVSGNDFDALSLEQTETGSLWLTIPFEHYFRFYFQGFYKHTFKLAFDSPLDIDNYGMFDFDYAAFGFKYTAQNYSSLAFSAGRTRQADISTLIFRQPFDGISFAYDTAPFSVSLFGGFTGLQNQKSYSVQSMSYTYSDDNLYPLFPNFAVSELKIAANNMGANHSFSAEFLGCWNIDSAEESDGLNRLYLTAKFDGPVFGRLYYAVNSTACMLAGSSVTFADMSEASLAAYTPGETVSFIMHGVYASADFKPFTYESAAIDDSYSYSSIIKAGAQLALKPCREFYLSGTGDIIFPIDENDTNIYLGCCQWQANLQWQIVSDLQFGLSAGQIIPLDDSDSYLTATARLLFTF